MAGRSFLSLRRTPNRVARCLNSPVLGSYYYAALSSSRCFSDKPGSRPQDGIPEGVEFEEVVDSKSLLVDPSMFTEEIQVRMPEIGEGEGKILKWFKEEGDVVQREDILCDIETPDFTFGMEIDDEELGIIGKILVEAGPDPVKDKVVICTIMHMAPPEKKKDMQVETKEEP
jgi:hypothetical protein